MLLLFGSTFPFTLRFHLYFIKLDYLYQTNSHKFFYAENIERTFDKNSSLSFSKIKDAVRSTSTTKTEFDVYDEDGVLVGQKYKYDHIPGRS
jgi:hypothetical protein